MRLDPFRMLTRRFAPTVCAVALAVLVGMPASSALADFRLCNNTASRVGVAVGYRDKEGWLTEGWWNIAARTCETILKGPLAARFYYVYAVDYDQGVEWGGQSFMCTREKEFTIRGYNDCLARGYDRTGFFEIDSGEQKSWTVQLSEQAQNGAKPQGATPQADPQSPTPVTPAPETPAPATPTPGAADPAPGSPPPNP
ncbi:MAG: DUF1036 domain-containing protein [Hyphomicrobiales bacterium]